MRKIIITSSESEESLLDTGCEPGLKGGLSTLSSSDDRSESFFSTTFLVVLPLPLRAFFFGGLVVWKRRHFKQVTCHLHAIILPHPLEFSWVAGLEVFFRRRPLLPPKQQEQLRPGLHRPVQLLLRFLGLLQPPLWPHPEVVAQTGSEFEPAGKEMTCKSQVTS